MSTVTADSILEKWLGQLKTVTEIRDCTGKVLGIYTPSDSSQDEEMYEKARQLFDPEEIERIYAAEHGKGRPLSEIWKDLESRESRP